VVVSPLDRLAAGAVMETAEIESVEIESVEIEKVKL